MPATPDLKHYREALQEIFPALPLNSLEYLSEGWDSLVFRVNSRLIFRFPKRPEVETALLKEARLLPHLAPVI